MNPEIKIEVEPNNTSRKWEVRAVQVSGNYKVLERFPHSKAKEAFAARDEWRLFLEGK